jgi:4-hydroxy-3-methylbut-2-enyl diphosphate reductase
MGSLNLHIEVDGNSGFCFGVVYAIEMAEEILDEQGYLYCLGDIVHNDEEVNRLKRKGLKIIDHETLRKLRNEKVLIRAHGEPPSTYKMALENELELIDASCPVVLKLQNRIKKSYDRDENILIYGKHGHAEVIGLSGQIDNNALVFQDINELNIADLPKSLTLYSQTTKSVAKFHEISAVLSNAGIEVKGHDTICRQVSNRDGELRKFARKFDTIVFVSGTKSSNGKVLYNVCRDQNPATYLVSNVGELKKDWFNKNSTVGICGATSTPMWLMEEVKKELSKY